MRALVVQGAPDDPSVKVGESAEEPCDGRADGGTGRKEEQRCQCRHNDHDQSPGHGQANHHARPAEKPQTPEDRPAQGPEPGKQSRGHVPGLTPI